jgi:RNA polymerase sigma-70 factor (ECF subfamily)
MRALPLRAGPPRGQRARQTVAGLYRRYGPVTYARCHRLLRNRAAAEDATQEVFLRVLGHLKSAPRDVDAVKWIHRIAVNYCLNVLRDQARRAEPMADLPERAGEHPDAWMTDRDLARELVMSAPAKLRDPALLHYGYGLEQQQIALALGISRRTVINRLCSFSARSRRFAAREGSAASAE